MRQAFARHALVEAVLSLRRQATGSKATRRSPSPPRERKSGRNNEWTHLYNADVISMPDKWEYPWYAAWDLAFHCVPLALVDPDFAKEQLMLLLREWYMHPNGQIPAYEWAFGDVNPPVHAWAAWRVYKIEKKRRGEGDRAFLERVFHKLLLNFTWWVNRKDAEGKNIFQGGFLGLDNIGVFDRSAPLPTGGHIEQSDGTSWMAMYCLNMLAIALELAQEDPAYEDVASKFWEHFLYIAARDEPSWATTSMALWDEEDGFFYDVLHLPDGRSSSDEGALAWSGLIPLFAVETLEPELLDAAAGLQAAAGMVHRQPPGPHRRTSRAWRRQAISERRLLAIVGRRPAAPRAADHARRTASSSRPTASARCRRSTATHPYRAARERHGAYASTIEPAESTTGCSAATPTGAGRSGSRSTTCSSSRCRSSTTTSATSFKVECPTGSGQHDDARGGRRRAVAPAVHASSCATTSGRRPVHGGTETFQTDPHWRDLLLFHEYFHGDNGAGLGASHQTGWTALVAKLLQRSVHV